MTSIFYYAFTVFEKCLNLFYSITSSMTLHIQVEDITVNGLAHCLRNEDLQLNKSVSVFIYIFFKILEVIARYSNI